MDPKQIAKLAPIFIGLFVIAILALAYPILFPAQGGKPPQELRAETPGKGIDLNELDIQDLKRRLVIQEKNAKILFLNQKKIVKRVEEIGDEIHEMHNNQRDDRKYIIAIYKELVNVEDQLLNGGGGYNLKTKIKEEEINPLIGTEKLPSSLQTQGPIETP